MSPLWLAQMCEWPSGASCFSTTRGGIGTQLSVEQGVPEPVLIEEGAGSAGNRPRHWTSSRCNEGKPCPAV